METWFGEYYYSKGNFKEARKRFDSVLKKYPQSEFIDDTLYWLGWTSYEEGKTEEALEVFRKLYTRFPESEWAQEAMFRSGDILSERGNMEDAFLEFNKVIEKYRNTSFSRTANKKIGRIMTEKGDYKAAIEYFKKSQTTEDTDFNAEAQYDIAEAYEFDNDTEQAIIEYLKVSYMYPRNTFWASRAELKCGAILEKTEKWDQAKKIYKRLAERKVKESEYATGRIEWLKMKE